MGLPLFICCVRVGTFVCKALSCSSIPPLILWLVFRFDAPYSWYDPVPLEGVLVAAVPKKSVSFLCFLDMLVVYLCPRGEEPWVSPRAVMSLPSLWHLIRLRDNTPCGPASKWGSLDVPVLLLLLFLCTYECTALKSTFPLLLFPPVLLSLNVESWLAKLKYSVTFVFTKVLKKFMPEGVDRAVPVCTVNLLVLPEGVTFKLLEFAPPHFLYTQSEWRPN